MPAWWLLAESASRTYYRFARLQAMSEWWHWLLLAVCCAVVGAYVVWLYRRDAAETSRGLRAALMLLRLVAWGGILFFFLDLEKRTEDRDVKASRAVLLIDTSQSMGLRDTAPGSDATQVRRMDQVIAELRRGELLAQLRARHDVAVYQFDEAAEPDPVAFFRRTADATQGESLQQAVAGQREGLRAARVTALAAAALAGVALAALIVHVVLRRWHPGEWLSFAWLVGSVSLVAAAILLAVASLRAPDLSLRAILGWVEPDFESVARAGLARTDARVEVETDEMPASDPSDITWQQALLPRGAQTRLGDAIRSVVNRERGGSLAGIVVATDGGQNAGVAGEVAARLAQTAGIPVYAVGLGSDQQPVNARVVDLEAPRRVYPGDKFQLTGYVQAYGLAGRPVTVQLYSAAGDAALDEADSLRDHAGFEEERSIRLPADGELVSLQFEVTPAEPGARQYLLRVVAPDQDVEARDDQKVARVQVVERRSRVLLVAGGPSREFRFLRNQLFRDRDVTLDVWLQSAGPGASQEAANLLTEFPTTAEALFEYDCIVAFDPDWLQLDEVQLELLERWVAQQAGGLVVLAGPVHTPQWAGLRRGRDARIELLRALYPVVFYSQGSPNLSLGRFGGDAAWPLQFTRDGLEAEFLQLEDDPAASEAAWQAFEGVYGYYAVKDPKPGARVFARFSNPETAIDGELPIYAAAHLYGAGRVYFQASGEIWRLRGVDPRYFESYYTKLLRWVAQGRLLRDSSRGVLLVDKDRCLLGDAVTVRAVLNDAQHQPLALAEVAAVVLQPDGARVPLTLRRIQDATREGVYEAEFTTVQPGDYRLELTPPESNQDELLAADVRVRVPALEIERPQRNDALLKEITQTSGGEYFIGFHAAMNRGGASRASLPTVLQPNDRIIYLPETVDKVFDQRLMGWLMALIVGTLCGEWLFRRLNKLA